MHAGVDGMRVCVCWIGARIKHTAGVTAADSNDTLADSGMHSLHGCVPSANSRPRLLDVGPSQADARIHSLDEQPNRAELTRHSAAKVPESTGRAAESVARACESARLVRRSPRRHHANAGFMPHPADARANVLDGCPSQRDSHARTTDSARLPQTHARERRARARVPLTRT